jgi:hypothetical protein
MREIEEGICIWVEGREERQNSECRMQNSEMEAGGWDGQCKMKSRMEERRLGVGRIGGILKRICKNRGILGKFFGWIRCDWVRFGATEVDFGERKGRGVQK